ncbi:MAG TPA: S-layer homology domain-containing protein [Thermoanaerobacterales bacterium]|nr:S-layer homology domain-containing protein [Thermoanaerobacterales bacterium]
MKKKLIGILLVVIMVISCAIPVLAGEEPPIENESLLDIIKPHVNSVDDEISRGAFSYLLVNAINMQVEDIKEDIALPRDLDDEWHKDAILTLWKEGIMKGVPGGNTYPNDSITVLQARTLVARTYGIPDEVIFGDISERENGLDERLYSYIESYFVGDADGKISVKEAIDMFSGFFETDEVADEIMIKNEEITNVIKSFRVSGNLGVEMVLAGEIDEEVPPMMDFEFIMELSSDNKIKQKYVGNVPELPIALEMTQYMDKDYIYTAISDEEGTQQWMKMKNFVAFVFDEDFIDEKKNEMFYMDTDLVTSYKLFGEKNIDGNECHELVFFTRIDNKEKLVEVYEAMPGMDDSIKELMKESLNIMDKIILKGIMYIGKEDNLLYKSDLSYDIYLNEEMQADSPIKMEVMSFDMYMNYSDYGEEIIIEIPQEAIDTDEIDLFGDFDFDDVDIEALDEIELE